MKENIAYLSLGSNIAPKANTQRAWDLLAKQGQLDAVSTVWESPAWGDSSQANYLNCAAILRTPLQALTLRDKVLRPIEAQLGRIRQANKFAPRPIDIDIMLFNQAIFNLDGNKIPSPEILERAFVAIPLAEIAPDYIHPIKHISLSQIAQAFIETGHNMQPRSDIAWP